MRSSLLATLGVGCFSPGLFSTQGWGTGFSSEDDIRDYLNRMKNFDAHFPTDIVVLENERPLLTSCVKKLRHIEHIVGYSLFTTISFPKAARIARNYPHVEAFSTPETEFLERIFYTDASGYGFFGKKTIDRMDHEVLDGDMQRVSGTPHYLYRGRAFETFQKVTKELGPDLILTSGVRGVVKQILLFLAKADANRGNLSLASRQLAPPGFSYHGVGDLDVGKSGFGAENFTERFMLTDVFRKLAERGYLSLRYPKDNLVGVRFEPWHIKIVDWA